MREATGEGALPRPRDWLLIDAEDPNYGDRVVRDLTRMVGTASGRDLLRRVRASGRLLRIVPPAPTDPPNAWIATAGQAATGTGPEDIIAFDPADWPSPAHAGSPAADVMLFALLREACRGIETGAAFGADPDPARPVYDAAAVRAYNDERDDV